MIKASVRHGLEFAAVVLLAAGALVAGLAWRFSQGPISLDFLRADIQGALARAFDGDLVSLGSAQIEWTPEDRSIALVLREVTVVDETGALLAAAPRLEAGLKPGPLMRGKVVFTRLIAEGGEATVMRRADGGFAASLGPPEMAAARAEESAPETRRAGQSAASARAALARLARGEDLEELRIESAVLHIVDEVSDLAWRVAPAELVFERNAAGLAARAFGEMPTEGGGTARVELSAAADPSLKDLLFSVHIAAPRLSGLAPAEGPLAGLAALDAPVTLSASASVKEGARLAACDLHLKLGEGVMQVGEEVRPVAGLQLKAEYDAASDSLRVAELALDVGGWKGQLEATLSGLAAYAVGAPGARLIFTADARALVIDARPVFERPLAVETAKLKGEVLPQALTVQLDSVDAKIAGASAALVGWARLEADADGKIRPAVRLSGPITGAVSYQDVLAFWPVELAHGAREYIASAIKSGRVEEATLDLHLPADALRAKRLADEGLSLKFAFDDAHFAFVSTMSPITAARGRAELRGNSFTLALERGSIHGLQVTEGFVDIPVLNPKGAIARFGGRAKGRARDMLAIIDEPPLNFARQYDVDPEAIAGEGALDVLITRPMLLEVPPEDYGFEAKGTFEGVGAPSPFENLPLHGADVAIAVNTKGVTASGTGMLGPAPATIAWNEDFKAAKGAPSTELTVQTRLDPSVLDVMGVASRAFMSGEAGLTLRSVGKGLAIADARAELDLASAELVLPGWRKPIDAPAKAAFTLLRGADGDYDFRDIRFESGDATFAGALALAKDGRLETLEVDTLKVENLLELTAAVSRDAADALLVTIDAVQLDARGMVAQLLRGASGLGIGAALEARIRAARVLVADYVSINDVTLSLSHDGARVRRLAVTGQGDKGPLEVAITPTEDGKRTLVARSEDAGLLLRAALGLEQIEGGRVAVEGELPALDAPPDAPTRLLVKVRDFQLVRAPIFAQVLSLGSLKGLADALAGGGISFSRLDVPITASGGRILVEDARAVGPALGVTVSGRIDLAKSELAVEGVIVPAYTFNSILGEVPLLGDLLVSRKGEGVFGLTYTVEGPFESTRVFVNPLAALAPGVLRRIFETPAESSAAEAAPPAPEPTAKPPGE